MRTFKSVLISCLSMLVAGLALAQQAAAPSAWKGAWNSNTSAATGDLTINLIQVADGKIKGQLAMTRPSNNLPRWSCVDTPIEFDGQVQGDQVTVTVDFKGGCNQNTFTFTVKDGQLKGSYKTQSGSHGSYVLTRAEVVAQVQVKD